MNRLAVLALCVGDGDSLVLADEHAGVAHLTTHLAVERSIVKHDFVICVLLLRNLAVTQDVTLIFCVVIAYELLLALADVHPV